ncbi:Uncharacterized protein DBV15_12250 [Temnothorax longispinosus]|uniref:MADF domain-containing protein n=1 Tax=Temnothorax longispinosus TaxID=300112 RepID=A0A4S2L0I6_9HYME|nr:Uncharacterized protein DBV15_12250 [Temnothorax longispinosus]
MHGCLEGYSSYAVDPNTLYFYPLADDGTTIVRRSNINNVEQLVDEPFYNNCGNNVVHISQKGKRKVSGQVKQISNKRSKLNDSAGNKLNFDDVEFLILEWDYSLPLLQRKSTIKQRLWSEIALALNGKISAEETQKKFKSLHDTTVSNINNDDSNLSLMDDEDNAESIRTDSSKGKKKKTNDGSTDAIERIADAICQEKNITLPPPPEPDEIDSFLSLVGFRLQKMPPKTRLEIMQNILQLTYERIIQENVYE